LSVDFCVLPVFTSFCVIVLQIKTKQFYDHIMQKLVKTDKNTEINKQSDVNFRLNWIKFGAVSYLLSCTYSYEFLWIWFFTYLFRKDSHLIPSIW
jgi:hypothetical protein